MFIRRLNNKFGNIWQEGRSFFPIFSNGRFLEAGLLPKIVIKITIYSDQIGGWAFIRAWSFDRD